MTPNELFYGESLQRFWSDQEFLESFLADFCKHNPRFRRDSKVGLEQQTKMLKASINFIYNSSGLLSVRNSGLRGCCIKDLG